MRKRKKVKFVNKYTREKTGGHKMQRGKSREIKSKRDSELKINTE